MPRIIVCYTDSAGWGGAEQALLTLVVGLDRDQWTPILAHHNYAGIAPLTSAARAGGIETLMVPRMPHGRDGLRRLLPFALELRRRGAAVFHAHLPWPLAAKQALLAATVARVPAVVATLQLHMDMPMTRPMRVQQRVIGHAVDRFILVSEDMRSRVTALLPWPARKLEVVRNAVDPGPLQRRRDHALRRRLVGPCDRPLVLVPARLDVQKGHVHLLSAATEIPDVMFALAGEGPTRIGLEALVGQLGLGRRVVFLGQRDDVPELLAASDVVVLPSLDEGLPIAVLEAMAVGTPVIATRVGGTPEAVLDGQTGLLVPPADPARLATAIRRLLADPALAHRLAAAARVRVEAEFSAGAMIERISAVYDELLERR